MIKIELFDSNNQPIKSSGEFKILPEENSTTTNQFYTRTEYLNAQEEHNLTFGEEAGNNFVKNKFVFRHLFLNTQIQIDRIKITFETIQPTNFDPGGYAGVQCTVYAFANNPPTDRGNILPYYLGQLEYNLNIWR
tara:strand:+ start:27 stop:431 length:405 start_codon:yes stop_codon:yes gene_type:complete